MAKRIRLENTEGKWWYCDKLDIYARNGYLATCECVSGWILVTDAEKEAADEKRQKEWEEKYNKKQITGYGGIF